MILIAQKQKKLANKGFDVKPKKGNGKNKPHLERYIDKHFNTTFEWGVNDCYTFVRGWIDEVYPLNKLPKVTYSSLKEAMLINRQYNWIKELNQAFDCEIVDKSKDGDLLFINDDFQCGHLIFKKRIWSIDPELGLVGLPVEYLGNNLKFFRIGRAY